MASSVTRKVTENTKSRNFVSRSKLDIRPLENCLVSARISALVYFVKLKLPVGV